MNVVSPKKQFESKRRLDALFRPAAKPKVRRVAICRPHVSEAQNVGGYPFPWPCYAGTLHESAHPGGYEIRRIVRVVASHFEISEADIRSESKVGPFIIPRQLAMYFAKVITKKSLSEIGRRLGDKDHTTVMNGVRKIESLISESPAFAMEVDLLRAKLEGGN